MFVFVCFRTTRCLDPEVSTVLDELLLLVIGSINWIPRPHDAGTQTPLVTPPIAEGLESQQSLSAGVHRLTSCAQASNTPLVALSMQVALAPSQAVLGQSSTAPPSTAVGCICNTLQSVTHLARCLLGISACSSQLAAPLCGLACLAG